MTVRKYGYSGWTSQVAFTYTECPNGLFCCGRIWGVYNKTRMLIPSASSGSHSSLLQTHSSLCWAGCVREWTCSNPSWVITYAIKRTPQRWQILWCYRLWPLGRTLGQSGCGSLECLSCCVQLRSKAFGLYRPWIRYRQARGNGADRQRERERDTDWLTDWMIFNTQVKRF